MRIFEDSSLRALQKGGVVQSITPSCRFPRLRGEPCTFFFGSPVNGGNLKEGGIVPRKMWGDRQKLNLTYVPLSAR